MQGTPTPRTMGFGASGARLGDAPRFTKHSGNPLLTTPAGFPGTAGIQYPYVFEWQRYTPTAPGKFGMAISTDHSSGGVWLAYADQLTGPWNWYNDAAYVYSNAAGSGSTESPCIIWDEANSRWNVYSHNVGLESTQLTTLAFSPTLAPGSFTLYDDGSATASSSAVLRVPWATSECAGDGHTGYAKIHRVGGLWLATHLAGGSDYNLVGYSYSYDGLQWTPDSLMTGMHFDFYSTLGWKLERTADLFYWRGRPWGLGRYQEIISGVNVGLANLVVYPLANDLLTITAKPTTVLTFNDSGAWDEHSTSAFCVFPYGNRLYLFYSGRNASNVNSVGVAISNAQEASL